MTHYVNRFSGRLHGIGTLVCAAILFTAMPARGAFHLWNLNQVYTNSSGSLQFIELRDTNGGQNFVGGNQIQVTNLANTQTNTFTLPAGNLAGNTLGHDLLFATAGAQAAGAPAADFIIPNNFLFAGGGTITFFGNNSGPYGALPTDGTTAQNWDAGTTVNSPTNYAGQTGVIATPEPATLGLLAFAGLGLVRRRGSRRRR